MAGHQCAHSQLCDLDPQQLSDYSVVGIRGAKVFEKYIYNNFKRHEVVNEFDQVLRMIHHHRVHFSVWPRNWIEQSSKREGIRLEICGDTPYLSFKLYSFIHKKYAWAIPTIEKAYAKFFSKQ